MTKEEFYKIVKPLIKIYDDIEIDMMLDIVDRIDNYDGIKGTLKWYLDKLKELKVFEKHNVGIINKNKSEIKKIIEDILKKTTKKVSKIDNLETYNKFNNANMTVDKIYNSVSSTNVIKEALKSTKDICNLINTKAIEAAKEEYRNILNKAYLETSTGVYTYTQSIKQAIDKMAENGILIANYDSGRKISIESAVRRDVITRVNQLTGDIELEKAKILKTNLVYVSQHLGARTRTKYTKNDYEAHDEWQGKVYMIEGSNDKYPNLFEKTGYKEMLGLKGINCYHNFRPFFEWEKIPETIDIEESKKEREKLDKMRNYERKIRRLKREKIISKKMGYEEDYKKARSKLTEVNKKYNEWLDNNNKVHDYSREYVSNKMSLKEQGLSAINENFTIENHPSPKLLKTININDEKEIENVLNSYENIIKYDKIENAIVITQNGKVYQCFGNSVAVWPNLDLGDELIGSIVTHNHPIKETNFSFSKSDINIFEKYKLLKLRGVDEKYIYEFDRLGKPMLKQLTIGEFEGDITLEYLRCAKYAIENNIAYRRWKNE